MLSLKRFSIRILLFAMAILCALTAYSSHWYTQQRLQNDLEWDFINEFQSAEAANLFTDESYILPGFVIRRMSPDNQFDFYRVTTLDFSLDNLNIYTDEQIEKLSILKSVHTVRICNPTLRPGLIASLKQLPSLKRIEITGNYWTDPKGNYATIQSNTFPVVEVVR